ncbi:glycogen/starch synthase [Bacteroidales bacterium OttesenSCG-928-K22]|nr:glycogen/starch synthase [Bacteroidales bacterium OttesenSCG-928-K22]
MDINPNLEKTRVLFISQEISPYLEQSILGTVCRYLPQGIQERNKEIRTFMPKFGVINERRNQLHEVIRLSGMNLIINDVDHPVIIKVASLSQVRMQIYFIDNEEYFHRKATLTDNGKMFPDNDERSIFFSRGVLETVKKLGWSPNLLNCHGWMAALTPLYINELYRDNPLFTDVKIVTTLYNDDFKGRFRDSIYDILKFDGIDAKEQKILKTANYINLMKCAIDNSDAIVFAEKDVNPKLVEYVKEKKLPYITYNKYDIDYLTDISDQFFDEILNNN